MMRFRDFIAAQEQRPSPPSPSASTQFPDPAPDGAGQVLTLSAFGLDLAAVLLPSNVLLEDRLARMNGLWSAIAVADDREVLVLAVSAGD
jgi:hypothetical protein